MHAIEKWYEVIKSDNPDKYDEILAEDSLEQIKSMRQKANKHCLECGTTSCTLKQWDEANIANQKICNRLFCKPIKRTQKKTLFASSENHGFGQKSTLKR